MSENRSFGKEFFRGLSQTLQNLGVLFLPFLFAHSLYRRKACIVFRHRKKRRRFAPDGPDQGYSEGAHTLLGIPRAFADLPHSHLFCFIRLSIFPSPVGVSPSSLRRHCRSASGRSRNHFDKELHPESGWLHCFSHANPREPNQVANVECGYSKPLRLLHSAGLLCTHR